MNNAYAMSASLETKKNQRATMITAGFAALMLLLMILLKWKLPVFEQIAQDPGIEVELNLPEEPLTLAYAGGGGGNPVQASGPSGIAPYVPPTPGEREESKDIETDDNDKTAPEVVKPVNPKPKATKVVENTSVVKTTPKPVIETPAPPKPKAVVGRQLTGSGKGGGADDYNKSGGDGTGNGVGKGPGNGGGTGNGIGGGTGPGTGSGSGPKVTRGDRKIVRHYSFTGDLEKAVIYANISVTPEGTGKFVSIARGSSHSSNAYKDAIVRYLQNIKFDRSDHESMVTVQFNFRVN
jgi:outer membrane biosynthesis protein TonB